MLTEETGVKELKRTDLDNSQQKSKHSKDGSGCFKTGLIMQLEIH